MTDMITLIYLDGLSGINYHRILTPFIRLKEEQGVNTHYFDNFNELKKWDLTKVSNLVISRRCSVSNHKEFKSFLKKNNIKLILDNDDFWDIPKDNPARPHYEKVEKKNILGTINIADEIWTPSEYLGSRMKKINPKVKIRVVPNTLYQKEKQWVDQDKDPNPKGLVRFGYLGANGHSEDLKTMGMTFEDHELYCMALGTWNDKGISYVDFLKAKHKLLPLEPHEYGALYKKFDVSLAPLLDSKFNRCKSELKVVEAGFTKTAIIASNVRPYKQAIINGKTGILCSSPGEWREAIKTMTIERAEDLANNLYEHCVKEYDLHTINKTRIEGLG